jgi:gas vesicle protein
MAANAQYGSISSGRTGPKVMLFVSGLALGYAAAALFAPKSGRELRSSLSEFAKTNSDRMSGAVRDAVGAARDVTRNMARRAGDAVDQGREKARGTMEAAALSVEGGSMPHAGDEMARERTAAGYQ